MAKEPAYRGRKEEQGDIHMKERGLCLEGRTPGLSGRESRGFSATGRDKETGRKMGESQVPSAAGKRPLGDG